MSAGRAWFGRVRLGWSVLARLRPWLTAVYLAAVLVGAYAAVRGHLPAMAAHVAAIPVRDWATAGLLNLAGLAMSMLAWRLLIGGMGGRLSVADASHIFFLGQLGKYLPGSIWTPAMQSETGCSYGLPRRANLASYVVAVLLSFTTALSVSGLALGTSRSARWFLLTVFSLPLILLLVAMSAAWPRLVASAPGWLATIIPATFPTRGAIGSASLLSAGSWVLHGLQLAVLASAAGIAGEGSPMVGVGAATVGAAAGLVVVFAPAGLGVREALTAAVLGSGAAPAVATTVIASRVVVVVADLAAGAFGVLIGAVRWRHRRRLTSDTGRHRPPSVGASRSVIHRPSLGLGRRPRRAPRIPGQGRPHVDDEPGVDGDVDHLEVGRAGPSTALPSPTERL